MSQHAHDISFPIIRNTSNGGLPSLAKTNLWWREKDKGKTVNKHSKQYFIWISLLLRELPKLVGSWSCFIQIFTVWQYIWYQMIATHSLQNLINFSSRTERICHPKSSWQLPQTLGQASTVKREWSLCFKHWLFAWANLLCQGLMLYMSALLSLHDHRNLTFMDFFATKFWSFTLFI